MKILHLISAPAPGGAELFVKDLAIQMVKSGHEVHIAFLSIDDAAGHQRDCFSTEYLRSLQAEGIEYTALGGEVRKKPWLGCIRLVRYINSKNIDLVHCHMFFGVLFSAFSSCPIIYTHHTNRQKFPRIVYKIMNTRVKRYVAISQDSKPMLERVTNKSVTLLRNGINREKFSAVQRQRDFSGFLNMVCVARIDAQKNLILLIDSISILPNEIRRKLHLDIYGRGDRDYESFILEYIRNKKLIDVIELKGVSSDIPRTLLRYDLFALSSSWEGLPISLIEASASGLPCLVTDVGGCREVVEEFQNGVIVPSGNVARYSSSIRRFVEEEGLVSRLSQAALDCLDAFSIVGASKEHLSVYRDVIAGD